MESLNTPGGHLVVLLLMMIAAMGGYAMQMPHCDYMIVGTYSALLYAMNVNPSQKPPDKP